MNYPKDIKAFYMRVNDGSRTVAAIDVPPPAIGEIIGGSQREERLDVLDARMAPREETSCRARRAGTAISAAMPGFSHARGRPRLRAHPRLRHRPRQRARRDPLPAHPRQRTVLTPMIAALTSRRAGRACPLGLPGS